MPTATAAQVIQASTLIDAFLQRPDGLMWAPDANGVPAYMAAKNADVSFMLSAPIAPGSDVPVSLPVPAAQLDVQAGDVIVLDRASETACEAVVVNGVVGNTVHLRNVQFAHAQGATLEFGMVITQQCYVPTQRPVVRLQNTPVFRVIGGAGRFGYGRRGDAGASLMDDYNLLASLTQFGGPPLWEVFDPAVGSLDRGTGQFWLPSSVYLAYYSEVRVHYVAGYSYASLPGAVKSACASLVAAAANSSLFAGGVKLYRAGDTEIERFANTVFDDDTKRSLSPLRPMEFV
ncbi:hypothetical protein [Burkholderia multivorans]|uniref:hypothetical protein n=1 Tax=Burkholderia multivorans TaxID=87883 RepID=UPI0021C0BDC4|nr:hypothetical protein [Burkholderia multivorans]